MGFKERLESAREFLADRPALVIGGSAVGILVVVAIFVLLTLIGRSQAPVADPGAPAAPGPQAIANQVLPPASFGEPLPGFAVISPFGLRQLPWEDHARLHAGVDIVAPEGTAVLAVAPGVVIDLKTDAGYGRYVRLLHAEGVTSMYAHLGSTDGALQLGGHVERGGVIGRVGNSGSSTGAHLHFEMRTSGRKPLDPTFFLGKTYALPAEWPLAEAAIISPNVRIAVVSNIPEAQRELMIAREEALADELATQELVALASTDAAYAELPLGEAPVGDGASPAMPDLGAPATGEAPPSDAVPATPSADPAAPAPASAAAASPSEPAPKPKPKRPAQAPRLAVPD